MLLYLTKKLFLKDEKSWKENATLFSLKAIVTKMSFTKFWPKISQELWQTTLNFILIFLNLETYHKNKVHDFDHALSNILHKSVNFNFSYICIKSLSLFSLLRIYLVEQIQFMNQILIYIHVFAYRTPGKWNSRANIL